LPSGLKAIPRGFFGAIGSFYRDFDQVDDEEVVALMESVTRR